MGLISLQCEKMEVEWLVYYLFIIYTVPCSKKGCKDRMAEYHLT